MKKFIFLSIALLCFAISVDPISAFDFISSGGTLITVASLLPAGMNMSGFMQGNLNTAQKLMGVNELAGNYDIIDQQVTSRMFYDTLPLDGRTFFNFFENVQTRTFPRTNLNQNKLQEGETMSLQRIYFCAASFDAVTGDLEAIDTLNTAGAAFAYGGEFTVNYDTKTVVKPYSLSSLAASFNKFSNWDGNEVITFDNNLILPKNQQFFCNLRTPAYVAIDDVEMRCVWEGFGTLFNPAYQN